MKIIIIIYSSLNSIVVRQPREQEDAVNFNIYVFTALTTHIGRHCRCDV